MEQHLRNIIEGVSNTFGEQFFNQITMKLHQTIGADYTFIALLDRERYVSQTMTLVAHGELAENFEYSLKHTPCADVSDNRVCCYNKDVCSLFPQDQLLIDMNIEAYIGSPLHDSKGQVMGLIVGLYENELNDETVTKTLFNIFSGRISAEIERSKYAEQLLELNENLEQRVQQRTLELETVLENLKLAQHQLIESEKLAALGNLVAGVAHEVNTPLGVAITAQSHLSSAYQKFKKKFTEDALSYQDMEKFMGIFEQGDEMIRSNLDRAANLVQNFKRTAADQHSFQSEKIALHEYYQRVASTLQPLLKKKQIALTIEGCEEEQITTYPGAHAQMLTNLIDNSVKHGFNNEPMAGTANKISINISKQRDQTLQIDYRDNGQGISAEIAEDIFQPFFTTQREQGSTGLGLSIIYNIAKQKFDSTLLQIPEASGVHFQYRVNDTRID